MSKIFHLILGTLIILFGVFLWNNPLQTLIAYCLYLGIMYLITATIILFVSAANKERPTPWASIIWDYIIGIVILWVPSISLLFFVWLFIFGYLAMACVYLYSVWTRRNHVKWHLTKIFIAVIGIICGIIMIINPAIGYGTLAKLIALAVMLSGFGYALPALV